MESKIMQVFYGQDCLPYKDKERSVHFPIVGNSFLGANNTTQIRFYVRDIGGVNNVSWVVVSKLPNGKIGNEILSQIAYDSEVGEYYVAFNLSAYYTNLKGDVYISLNGYQGQIQVETDQETNISTIVGTPTIQATGSIKLAINYAPQLPLGQHFNISDLQQILGLISAKANVVNTVQVVADISQEDLSGYDEGQLFYDLASKEYYEKHQENQNHYRMVENGAGILASKSVLLKTDFAVFIPIFNLIDSYEMIIVNYDSKEYLLKVGTKPTAANQDFEACAIDLLNRCFYYSNTLRIGNPLGLLINESHKIEHLDKKDTLSTVYAVNGEGSQIMLAYNHLVQNNALVRRVSTGDINVPLSPSLASHAASKKYIDDIDAALRVLINTLKKNAFTLVDTDEYPTLASFLASEGEEGYIYLYPVDESDFDEGNPDKGYYQYIWEDDEWLNLGTTTIDLSDYYTKSQTNSLLNGKVDKTSNNNRIYGTNGSGNQATIQYSANADAGYIPQRTENGHIVVPQTPTSDNYATSKYYVDSLILSLNNSKVDKTSDANKVYGTASNGTQKTFDVDNTVGADGNIVRRASGTSQIMVPLTPTANGHASSKKYVDDSIATAISTVYKIKGSKTVAEINALTGMQVGDVYNMLDSGDIVLGNLQVFTGDNIVWTGSAWDKLGAEIDWSAYDEKFIAAGFFEVQPYNESTGEITFVYATDLYIMSYDTDTGVMTIKAN